MGSGPATAALMAVFATKFPLQIIYVFGIVPVQARVLLVIYFAVDLIEVFQSLSGRSSWVIVAHTSHLWGIVFGYLYYKQNWNLSRLVDRINLSGFVNRVRIARKSRKFKVYRPEPIEPNLDEQVDAILAKIHEHGSESLSDRERSILQKAADRAKSRSMS
jgi:hypothetical protein